jgi:hypothetical protein
MVQTRRKTVVAFGCYHALGWSKNRETEFWAQATEAKLTDLFETRCVPLAWLGLPFDRRLKKLDFTGVDVLVVRPGYARAVAKLRASGENVPTLVTHDADEARLNQRDKQKQLLKQVLAAVEKK